MAKPSKSNLRFIKDPIMNPYYIQLDDHCYIAQKSTFSEAGHEYQNTIGHYSALGPCLEAIARDGAKSSSYDSLREFVERFEAKSRELINIIKA
tara:strand:+ start:1936 stop:2217 length:282 start_codon:yes stop_codon:yes gene_type:complete